MGAHYKIFMLWNIHLIFFLISGSIYIWTETVIYYMLNRISLICTMYSLHIQNVYTRISATAGSENQKKLIICLTLMLYMCIYVLLLAQYLLCLLSL